MMMGVVYKYSSSLALHGINLHALLGSPSGAGLFAHSGGWLDHAECTGCILFPDPLPISLQVLGTTQVDICTQILVLVSTSGATKTKTVVSTEFLGDSG